MFGQEVGGVNTPIQFPNNQMQLKNITYPACPGGPAHKWAEPGAGAILTIMQTSGSKPCPCPSFKLREVASMYFTMIAVFLVILVVALQGSAPRGSDFPYKVPLDPQGLLELSWNVSYPEQAVHFQLLIKDLQFGLLFGMSDRGEFENADLAVLWSDGHNSYFGVSRLCVCMAAFGVASPRVNLAHGLKAWGWSGTHWITPAARVEAVQKGLGISVLERATDQVYTMGLA